MIDAIRRLFSDPSAWIAGIVAAGGVATAQIPDVSAQWFLFATTIAFPALIVLAGQIIDKRHASTLEAAHILAEAKLAEAKILAEAEIEKARIAAAIGRDSAKVLATAKVEEAAVQRTADQQAGPAPGG